MDAPSRPSHSQRGEQDMNDHNYSISFAVDQSPEQVFNAINNIRGWWSEEIAYRSISDESATKAYAELAVPALESLGGRFLTRSASKVQPHEAGLKQRNKKVIGQLESVLRGLNEDSPCADVLQRLATARGGINSLLAELMEDHIRNHMPATSKPLEDAADDLIEIVRTYLK
jgi:DNA-binding FrmR family transcriptional regulator